MEDSSGPTTTVSTGQPPQTAAPVAAPPCQEGEEAAAAPPSADDGSTTAVAAATAPPPPLPTAEASTAPVAASVVDPVRFREENEEYLRQHPELKHIMAYYTAQLLAEKPTESITAWSAALFAQADLKERVERHTAAVTAAAAAATAAAQGGGAGSGASPEPPPNGKPPSWAR